MTTPRTLSASAAAQALNYEKLFQVLPGAYIVFLADDPMFTIIDENETHAQVAMKNRRNVIGKPLLKAFPDASEEYVKTGVSRLVESIRKVIKTGKPDTMPDLKYDLMNKKGVLVQKYWSVTHYPIFDDKKKVIAVYQATEDITQQTHTEQRLRLTEYQLGQALVNGGIGTWVWDIGKELIVGDENMAKLFGLPANEATKGLPLSRYTANIHPDDQERVSKEIHEALEKRTTLDCEYRTIDAEDNVHWLAVRGRVELDETDTPVTFPGVAVDITKRKNAEDNLRFLTKASTLFSASLDYKQTLTTIAGMVVPTVADWCTIDLLDENGVLQQVAVAHKDPDKAKWARELREIQGPPDMNAPSGVPKVIRTGKPEFYPYITNELLVAVAKDKQELEVLRSLGFSSAIIAPLKVGSRVIGTISLIATESRVHYDKTDLELAQGLANRAAFAVYKAELFQSARQEIEERKRLQKQLASYNVNLEKRVVTRTQQLETTNKGLEEEITKRQQVEQELQEYGKNLARSNQELQDFAYVASHDLQEPLRKIQAFGDILENEFSEELGEGAEYLARMRDAAARMSILIEDLLAFSRITTKARPKTAVNLPAVVRDVLGDLESRIETTGGKVEVGTLPTVMADPTHMRQLFQNLIGNALKFHRPDILPVVKVYSAAKKETDGMHTIYIEDNGIGFEEKYLDRIFSVFQRLHGKDTYEGTGIGLAVCRKIAERYGGTITATSKKNKGSTFIFKLPIEDKEPSDGSSKRSDSNLDGR